MLRARGGDGIAFSTLVERHYVRVVMVAEGVAGSLPLGEICAQEAFARACGRLARLASSRAFRALVYRTAVARALVRRAGGPARGPSRREVPAQAVLLLREQAGLSYADIADCLRLSTVQVPRLLRRGRALAMQAEPSLEAPLAILAGRRG